MMEWSDLIKKYGSMKGIYFSYITGTMPKDILSEFEDKFLVPARLHAYVEMLRYQEER